MELLEFRAHRWVAFCRRTLDREHLEAKAPQAANKRRPEAWEVPFHSCRGRATSAGGSVKSRWPTMTSARIQSSARPIWRCEPRCPGKCVLEHFAIVGAGSLLAISAAVLTVGGHTLCRYGLTILRTAEHRKSRAQVAIRSSPPAHSSRALCCIGRPHGRKARRPIRDSQVIHRGFPQNGR